MKPTAWTFPERDNDPAAELWLPETDAGPVPAVVLVPDLLGRPGLGLTSALAPELAKRGFVALAVSPTAGVGTSRFREATLRERLGDVARAVTGFFERMAAGGRVDIRKLAIVGHGIGGAVAAAEAAHDSRVGAVALLGAPRAPGSAFSKKATHAWEKGSSAHLRDDATGEEPELGPALFLDWKTREAELDHAVTAAATGAHVLWIHGTDDEQTTIEDSRRAFWKHPDGGRRARLLEIAGAKHDLGVSSSSKGSELNELSPVTVKVADAIQELLASAFPKS